MYFQDYFQDEPAKKTYIETATEESIEEEQSYNIIKAQEVYDTHLEHFESDKVEAVTLCYFSSSWQPETETSEQLTFMVETPSYHENITFCLDKTDVQYEDLESISPEYFRTDSEEPSQTEEVAKDVAQSVFLLETPEYQA